MTVQWPNHLHMKYRFLTVALLLSLNYTFSLGQTAYKGIVPGTSRRVEVERILSSPVKQVSETLVEYGPQPLSGRIYVQYRPGSTVVERIEFICRLEDSSCDDFLRSLNIRFSDDGAATGPEDEKGRYVVYYGTPHFVAKTINKAGSEDKTIIRVAFYSRELYETAVGGIKATSESAVTVVDENRASRSGDSKVANNQAIAESVRRDDVDSIAKKPPISGSWNGAWTNSRGESGNTTVYISEADGERFAGDEGGWLIENGRRSGNVLTWEYRGQNNGCRDYKVRWEISSDGRTANGTYEVFDHCQKQTYFGKYLNYSR